MKAKIVTLLAAGLLAASPNFAVAKSAGSAAAQSSSELMFLVRFGSTGMPGPIVVEKVIFLT